MSFVLHTQVTFFFNGGQEKEFEGEHRCMVPSPKVATYDLQPEMSVKGVAEKLVEAIAEGKHPFIMCNFAPPGMQIEFEFFELSNANSSG